VQKAIAFFLILLSWDLAVGAQTTTFTYQGRLNDQGWPAHGNFDFCFQLMDASTNLVAGPVTNSPVWVTNGLFTVSLDFGSGVFTGPSLWLAIGVRGYGQTSAYTVLSPCQPLTATPYALHALTSEDAAAALQATTNQVSTYYSNNIVPFLTAATKNSITISNLPYITLSPHGRADHCSTVTNCGMMFGIDTPGTVTGGLQEAVDAINAAATNISAPAGGKIEIAPGTVYTYATVTFQATNCTYVVEGAGLSTSGILYMGTQNVPVLYFAQPTNFHGVCPQIFLRDLFVAATNDIRSYLIQTTVFGKLGIEDCWLGYYPFMAYGNGYNGSGTFGFVPPSYGGTSASYLCGIYLEGSGGDDIGWINNCDFSGLACGLVNNADHSVVDNNMFLFCGNNSAWPNLGSYTFSDNISSLLSLRVSVVQGHSVHTDCRYHNDYFYGGYYAYAMDDSYGPNAVVSDGDGFESMAGDMFISTQSKFTQMNAHGSIPESQEISASYMSTMAPYEPVSSNPSDNIRTVFLNFDNASFTGYNSISFGNASVELPAGSEVPTSSLPGITTNYTVAGGATFYITNGVIMKIQ
jgi:hypothetical protein